MCKSISGKRYLDSFIKLSSQQNTQQMMEEKEKDFGKEKKLLEASQLHNGEHRIGPSFNVKLCAPLTMLHTPCGHPVSLGVISSLVTYRELTANDYEQTDGNHYHLNSGLASKQQQNPRVEDNFRLEGMDTRLRSMQCCCLEIKVLTPVINLDLF
ncbi:hypothetical protein MJT46_018587 [Ovis ammon polii x Ovis aries]|nr:hypothetical protein MJT46_018587 [Ovis ammon polii x Ovis aries]